MQKSIEIKEEVIEVIIAILLGVTAILSAWATWIGALHDGNQATNFTESNNCASKGAALYNESSELIMQDMMTWETIQSYAFDMELASMEGDDKKLEILTGKMEMVIERCSPEFKEAIHWALEKDDRSPFDKKGFLQSYYKESDKILLKADKYLKQGKKDNKHSDAFGLVSVVYSIVLFLLGIVGIFKSIPNRLIILGVAVVFLVCGFVFMMTIPMPDGFSITQYIGA